MPASSPKSLVLSGPRRPVIGMAGRLAIAVLLLFTFAAFGAEVPTVPQRQARIKDIASVEGIRDNQLVGYGLVVGLNNTGDSQQTTFPTQTLVNGVA